MEGEAKKVSSKFSVECITSEDCDSDTKSKCSPSKTCGECEDKCAFQHSR